MTAEDMVQRGLQYLYGDSVEQNDELAAQWFRKAADLGNESAKAKLQ